MTRTSSLAGRPRPGTPSGLVDRQIEALLPGASVRIDTVAQSLAMGRRGLQRKLVLRGLTYSQLLA